MDHRSAGTPQGLYVRPGKRERGRGYQALCQVSCRSARWRRENKTNLGVEHLHWIAPTEGNSTSASLEKRLWDAADPFRANSGLKAQEYSGPILGLIFLRFAEVRFAAQRARLKKAGSSSRQPAAWMSQPPISVSTGLVFLACRNRSTGAQPHGTAGSAPAH